MEVMRKTQKHFFFQVNVKGLDRGIKARAVDLSAGSILCNTFKGCTAYQVFYEK